MGKKEGGREERIKKFSELCHPKSPSFLRKKINHFLL